MKANASTLAFALAATAALLSPMAATSAAEPSAYVASATSDASYSETPASANAFVNSIGFDAEFELHQYPALVATELVWSGVRHIRDGAAPSTEFVAQMAALGKHGINHAIGMPAGFAVSDLRHRLAVFMPYVDYVEPANEADNDLHPSWTQMRTDQKNLWTTVRSNKAWNNVGVAGPSFANPHDHAALVGPLDAVEDFGVLHNSTCDWNPGITNAAGIDANTAEIRITTRYKPIWTTETGYGDNLARGCSLPDDIIAKYEARTATERWLHGEPRTYFDILVDQPKNVVFGSTGLLHANGTPKAQFIALGNLVRLLADPGTAPKSTHVSYSISGITADVHHILLARRDGSYDLIIYREVACWDHHTRKRLSVGTESATIKVSGLKQAALYKYNSAYAFSQSALAVRSGVTAKFPVTDAISIVHFAL